MFQPKYTAAYLVLHLFVQFCPLKAANPAPDYVQPSVLAEQIIQCDGVAFLIEGRLGEEERIARHQLRALMERGRQTIANPVNPPDEDRLIFAPRDPALINPFYGLQDALYSLPETLGRMTAQQARQDARALAISQNIPPHNVLGTSLTTVYHESVRRLTQDIGLEADQLRENLRQNGSMFGGWVYEN